MVIISIIGGNSRPVFVNVDENEVANSTDRNIWRFFRNTVPF